MSCSTSRAKFTKTSSKKSILTRHFNFVKDETWSTAARDCPQTFLRLLTNTQGLWIGLENLLRLPFRDSPFREQVDGQTLPNMISSCYAVDKNVYWVPKMSSKGSGGLLFLLTVLNPNTSVFKNACLFHSQPHTCIMIMEQYSTMHCDRINVLQRYKYMDTSVVSFVNRLLLIYHVKCYIKSLLCFIQVHLLM